MKAEAEPTDMQNEAISLLDNCSTIYDLFILCSNYYVLRATIQRWQYRPHIHTHTHVHADLYWNHIYFYCCCCAVYFMKQIEKSHG